MKETIQDIKCIDEKGYIKFIPQHLTNNYSFMRRNKLSVMSIPKIEPIEPETENLELIMEEVQTEFNPEIITEVPKDERADLFAQLDAKGITYKKTFGIIKLKELLNQ